jgi:hypothetical protein
LFRQQAGAVVAQHLVAGQGKCNALRLHAERGCQRGFRDKRGEGRARIGIDVFDALRRAMVMQQLRGRTPAAGGWLQAHAQHAVGADDALQGGHVDGCGAGGIELAQRLLGAFAVHDRQAREGGQCAAQLRAQGDRARGVEGIGRCVDGQHQQPVHRCHHRHALRHGRMLPAPQAECCDQQQHGRQPAPQQLRAAWPQVTRHLARLDRPDHRIGALQSMRRLQPQQAVDQARQPCRRLRFQRRHRWRRTQHALGEDLA